MRARRLQVVLESGDGSNDMMFPDGLVSERNTGYGALGGKGFI